MTTTPIDFNIIRRPRRGAVRTWLRRNREDVRMALGLIGFLALYVAASSVAPS